MNRSILIVIVDFLLVTLLAFSNMDENQMPQGGAPAMKLDLAKNQENTTNDVVAVMKLALEEQQKTREQLKGQLEQAQKAVGDRGEQVQAFQKQIQSREQEALRLQQAQASLERQLATAQTNIQSLNQQLQSDAATSKERLSLVEAQAKKEAEDAAALQRQLSDLARSNLMALNEKQRLAGQLQIAEVEKRAASEHAARMEEQVKVEREEKAKLAEGVKALASKSSELAQEVRENRPLAPNTIFSEFLANRVEADLRATRSGMLGIDVDRHKETGTILVTNGTNTYALCHIQDTPLSLGSPGTDWEKLTGTLGRSTSATFIAIRSLSFSSTDPRVVMIPVTAAEAQQLGSKPYKISADPYKFQDAVLVGAQDNYYGECKFQIDSTTPEDVRLDRDLLKGLFGKFNPSRGDLVFSKNGEVLGVMANSSYCMMLRRLEPTGTLKFGPNVKNERTGETLSRLYVSVAALPVKLQ